MPPSSLSPSVTELSVQRTARVVTHGRPDAATWVVLIHGYGQTADRFLQSAGALAADDRFLLAPEGLSRFYVDAMEEHRHVGASWMTRRMRETEIREYVRYLGDVVTHFADARTAEAPPRLVVLGFSQGTATASRFAVLGDVDVDRLVLWAGGMAHDLDLSAHADALRGMDLTFAVGTRDEYISEERAKAALQAFAAHDIPVAVHRFDGGHRLDDATLQAMGV